jgi:hypothetical protein
MAQRRFRIWIPFIIVPLLVIPMALADKWMPLVFEPAWYAQHGHTARTIITVLLMLGIAAAFILPDLGSMFSFFGGSPKERRIRKFGRPARATIVRVGENSGGGVVTVNDQPYLNLVVRVEDGVSTPYETDFDTIISRTSLPQLQPGAVVKVKVDPQDPRKVVLDY